MQTKNFTESSLNRLSKLLHPQAESGNTMRCDEVQGFMMAQLSGPDELDPVNWLPEVLGDESLFDEAQRDEVQELVLEWVDDMCASLKSGELPELQLYEDETGAPDFYTWCNAYLYALDVVETDWFERAENEDFEDLFYPIMALGGIYDEEENGHPVLKLSDKEIAQMEAELPHALLDIFRFWQGIINKPQTVRREGEKIGRNDPCPCGSGKKYKACCGKS